MKTTNIELDVIGEEAESPFESIKKIDENGIEYWVSREFGKMLEYSEYRKFLPVIEKAKKSCKNSGHFIDDHFAHMADMVELGSGAKRTLESIRLTRYACYLVIQNADPNKEIVSLGQTYFAVQTYRQEVSDKELLAESKDRQQNREAIKNANKESAELLNKNMGVSRKVTYANFHDGRYLGLYGKRCRMLKRDRGLSEKDKILDHMDTPELALNYATAALTNLSLQLQNITDAGEATRINIETGADVRELAIKRTGIKPEDLPLKENIKRLDSKSRKVAIK